MFMCNEVVDMYVYCCIRQTLSPSLFPQQWRELEKSLLLLDIAIPVYFAVEDESLPHIHDSLSSSAEQEKAASVTASE